MVTVTIISDVLERLFGISSVFQGLWLLWRRRNHGSSRSSGRRSGISRSFGPSGGSLGRFQNCHSSTSTVLQFYISFSVHFSAYFSALSEGVEFGRSESQAHVGPQWRTSISRPASRWDPWLRTGSTDAFVDLSGLEGGGLCVFWAGIEEGWLEDGSPFLYGGVENRSTSFLWFFPCLGIDSSWSKSLWLPHLEPPKMWQPSPPWQATRSTPSRRCCHETSIVVAYRFCSSACKMWCQPRINKTVVY